MISVLLEFLFEIPITDDIVSLKKFQIILALIYPYSYILRHFKFSDALSAFSIFQLVINSIIRHEVTDIVPTLSSFLKCFNIWPKE